jgi:hypothetical protein
MIIKLCCVLLVILCLVDAGLAQERMRIAWAGASPANAGIWVLQEKKLLQNTASSRRSSASARAPSSCKPYSPARSMFPRSP